MVNAIVIFWGYYSVTRSLAAESLGTKPFWRIQSPSPSPSPNQKSKTHRRHRGASLIIGLWRADITVFALIGLGQFDE